MICKTYWSTRYPQNFAQMLILEATHDEYAYSSNHLFVTLNNNSTGISLILTNITKGNTISSEVGPFDVYSS